MRCKITLTMTGKLSRIFYGNVFTKYLHSEEDPDFDIVLPALTRSFDITRVQGPDEDGLSTLTAPECNAQDECLFVHLYGMMDLQLRIGGRPALNGLGPGPGVPLEEDENTPEPSVHEDDT
ncbi:hypothetical protein A4A49_54018 [Nicotiana attenuata]|uniref:Uncharacterized protein n=1 Tax=Nicotiana attenuata TaxID=49451 RepID=A0A1J6JQQ6_NICAT|nr:hypothetical protein A4A49_54018 [Nicotiana attenuata]